MIAAAHLSKPRSAPQAAPVSDNSGLAASVKKLLELSEWRKELEREARKIDKEEKTIEGALSDAVEVHGGTLVAGEYTLSFTHVAGVPSYKTICEKHIAPAILAEEVAATEKRRKLVVG